MPRNGAPVGRSASEQAASQGVADQFGAGAQPELLVYPRPVGLDSAWGEMQLARDLHARVPERDQPQDFDLPPGQLVLGKRPVQSVQPARQLWAEVLLTPRSGAD